ncbi:MAG: glycoside hydrolase family 88 protein [Treponema sp.]|jgi:unsaturated chondroitin disaccharide hydrolase|nr:glycoside hydrolase family 88 protein [Treponema sp.]
MAASMNNFDLTGGDLQWAQDVWTRTRAKIEAQCGRVGSGIPYIARDGRYGDKAAESIYWWTNGFWPGILWLMYAETGSKTCRRAAEAVETRLDTALAGYEGLHHDLGFMWTLSAGMDFKLTGNPLSRVRALHAANLLAGRYNPRGRFIRAWNKGHSGWIIIDSMMNLPLLYWASKEIEDPRYRYIAQDHADTVLKYLVRPDGSCNHIGILDVDTGALLETPAGQGFASGSSWSRGQAWALYGFALSYAHTGERRYLETALRIARYFTGEVSRFGFTPPVDFRAPEEPKKLDTSAGMIAAAGLLFLAGISENAEKDSNFGTAMKLLKTAEASYADWDTGRDSIIQMGTAQYHGKPEECHVPLIYSDYFFMESVYRLLHPGFEIW